MKTETKTTDAQIREHCGHNGHECRVRITNAGQVERHGSPDPTDRSEDSWVWLGSRTEIVAEMES